MVRRHSTIAAAFGLALIACAKLAGLESSDPGDTPNGGGSLPTTPEGITVAPAKLEVSTTCGIAGDGPSISITNSGAKAVDFQVKVPEESSITLRDDKGANGKVVSGVVAPGKVVQIATCARSTKPGGTGGNILVTTAGREQTLPMEVTIKGGDLVLTPALIDFGDVRQNTTERTQSFDLRNTGNEPVTVSGWISGGGDAGVGDFSMKSGSVTVAPGETGRAIAAFAPGPAGSALGAEFSPATVEPLCGVPPKIQLRGRRVSDDVTVNPATVSFGTIDCNASAAPTAFTVSNYSPVASAAVSVSLRSGAESWLTVAPPNATVATAGADELPGTSVFTVNLTKSPMPGNHSEEIAVTINSSPTPKIVTASLTVIGAFLQFSPTSVSFSGSTRKQTVTVTNTGNTFIYVGHASSSADFSVSPGNSSLFDTILNSSTFDVNLVAASGTHAADIITTRKENPLFFPTSGKLCNTAVVKATSQ